ncbi:MAG: alpha/beta hydrolase [Candidatus Rokubacteria bacterium]|nr:alpha/beta hydrolase [Candidatus Rokubacteria bacterium]
MAAPKTERVATNGITLAARVWPGGDGAVVGIHGLTANHTCWFPIAGVVAPRRRLIGYDLRGRGDSNKPASGYSLAIHDADLLGLLDHFGIGRAILAGHSLGAHIAVRFAAHHPDRVDRIVLFDGGLDVRAEVFDSIAPAVNRLGIEFPSLDAYLAMLRGLPMFAGRWNAHLDRYFTYDVEPGAGGGVRSKVVRHAIEEEVANLQRTRLWVWHHRIAAPALLLRAPDGLLRADDCLMTQEEAEAMARAIPRCRLVVVPGTNHYTILLGENPLVAAEVGAFLA